LTYLKNDLNKNKTEIDRLKISCSKRKRKSNSYYETYIAELEGTAGNKKIGERTCF
jgi:hypothetical protein